ncbi:mannitol dehydrogenase family protein [Leifsonia sp. Root4]|uniref:mannitol dehydrogenase family protein n=1 Tax=Leifsonia sp. Root4 TaxID=1736525 RepID=UPI000A9A6AFA|nr:mannitol dehydrogenase family protein [Leifsonia sp. Root4]
MTAALRLSSETLARLQRPGTAVELPLLTADELSLGIVHFGIGAFHRAHQAVYTERAAAAEGETHWGILGVTGRTDAVALQLQPQDCLYGVLEKSASDTRLQLVSSVRDVAWPRRDSEQVVATLAASTTHLATLTITEKGYLRAPDGRIDLSLPAVVHDLALIDAELSGAALESGADGGGAASQTPIGLLVRGLARRHRNGVGAFSVVSCDNMVDNGGVTRRLVESLAAALPAGAEAAAFRRWLAASVTFPSTMVDRIAPATTDADRAEALELLGLQDDALVVAEPFSQWVIEDDFAGPRPAWQKAGAILTEDVAPYEMVKLRTLNATHSLLAWLGALSGHRTIASAVGDERLRALAVGVIDDDILPTLTAPAGIDLAEYRDSVLERFANPSLAHTTAQVAMDGSQKLPVRILGTVADRLAAGATPRGLALVVAAWIGYVAASTAPGGHTLDDPIAAQLQSTVGSETELREHPDAVVGRMLALPAVFPAEVGDSLAFREAVVAQLVTVQQLTGSRATG